MTELDKEIQELRRELDAKKKELDWYKEVHMLDISEIAYLRRQIDFLMESEATNGPTSAS